MIIFYYLNLIQKEIITFFHVHHLIGPFIFLILEEAGIPFPVPGDVVISYTGYQVSRGHIWYSLAVFALLSGVVIGSSILYFLSRHFGEHIVIKFGKYIHLNKKKLNFIEKKFRQYGPIVIIIGRHIPGFRIPVTVFAGISRVKYSTFVISEIISTFFWILLFLQIGAKLGKKTLELFHNNYSFLFLLIIPIVLTLVTFFFGKFIPESDK